MTGSKLAYAAAVVGASSSKDGANATNIAKKATAAPAGGDGAERPSSRTANDTSKETRPEGNKQEAKTPARTETAVQEKSQQEEKKVEQGKPERKDNHEEPLDRDKKSAWKKLDADTTSTKDKNSKDEPTPENKPRSKGHAKENGSGHNNNSNKNKSKKGGNANHGSKSQNKSKQQGNNRRRQQHSKKKNNSNNKGEKGGKNSGKKKKSRNKKQNKGQRMYPLPLSPAEFEQLKQAVVYQVEYFFSDDELSRNTYLRRHMDVDGYIPAAIIFNFPSIAAYCFQYYDLLALLSEKSSLLEIDQANETMRRKNDYKTWLCPNAEGGFGCPRWIKEVQQVDRTNPEPAQDEIAANRPDDASSGSNVTPDTDSCTDSENSEHAAEGILSS